MTYRRRMSTAEGLHTQAPLIGRDAEIQAIGEFLDGLSEHGGTLMVRGEAGIGKSALLDHARERAGAQGALSLETVGAESETHFAFASLHLLLQPILGRAEALPTPQRSALDAAFGLAEEAEPDRFRVALAAFQLICEASESAPVLLIADDAHLIDRSSLEVLAFIARRLGNEQVGLLAAVRDGHAAHSLEEVRLQVLHLEPLDERAAAELLDRQAPELADPLRVRVLHEAAGNPLGVVELGIAVASEKAEHIDRSADSLPLTARLERTFAGRLDGLGEATRLILLGAALDDRATLPEVLAAVAEMSAAETVTFRDLDSAVLERLVSVAENRVKFRHPLIRSAVQQQAPPAQVEAMHSAFSRVVADADRRLWHLAACTSGYDEELAIQLEQYSDAAARRGAITTAVAALERAAALSPDPRRKSARLVRAAELSYELGLDQAVRDLLEQAAAMQLGTLEEARMSWLRQMVDGNVWSGTGATRIFVDIADRLAQGGEADTALSSLVPVALRCWWTHTRSQTRAYLVESASRMTAEKDDPRLLAVEALAEPDVRGADAVARLARAGAHEIEDPVVSLQLGLAACGIGEFIHAAAFLAPAVETLREQGRLGILTQALVYQAWAGTYTGEWRSATAVAAEAARLASDTRQPQYGVTARLISGLVSAMRGSDDDLDRTLAGPERAMLELGGGPMLAPAHLARGMSALGERRHEEAFDHLWPIFDPNDAAFHAYLRWWAVLEMAEAASRSGHLEEVRRIVAELEPIVSHSGSTILRAGLLCAAPLLADDEQAENLYSAALVQALASWPFMRARTLLSYGEWLRRQRRVADSRRPLRGAGELFNALGATRWGERARQELRATGETVARRGPDTRDELTPQELQIAELAASGLSNREIGERLFLSHRTVGSHLYRIFPKLEITSRAQLSSALANAGGE
jgi:DNA-binding CsgD family transcriptional regulator